ncbi:MAG: hypothetical protein IKK20_03560 [Clostridia bacterium]|nr:hypothetical protein [Clostridia bacterium]MBR3790863.1 hypothetical protein [Clostridia bacterium]
MKKKKNQKNVLKKLNKCFKKFNKFALFVNAFGLSKQDLKESLDSLAASASFTFEFDTLGPHDIVRFEKPCTRAEPSTAQQ